MIETFSQSIVEDDDSAVRLIADDVELAHYVYRPDTVQMESPKPYIHPLRTRAGRLVSLFRPHDHVWHKGISLALPNAGPHNFWGGPTYTRRAGWYEQLPNNGTQAHVERLAAPEGSFAHALEWLAEADGSTVFTEVRRLTTTLLDADAWALRWETSLRNVSGETIAMGSPTTEGRENAGYGGVFWRGPRSFSDGSIVTTDGTGDAEDLRGTRHSWMGFVGKHDGEDASSTVIMADLDDTPKWFVRSGIFACLGPAPFFDEEVAFEPDTELSLRYDVVIADGASDSERAAGLVRAAREAGDAR
ncbi:hypothetical protein GCM10010910_22600 [Microbacterium nanhaiense]|uniref:Methane oxygenase PmoA n=1 Tax=Microbacterium nanhaiense TaxID=1301026 RepID=A0ABQ2N342_9MICO|nr:PmoA family protein [Microbacterium nanhaiense]GGO65440.1 hypothetical protein GCM10010910_22600 [Microbacterium nanhaiense]